MQVLSTIAGELQPCALPEQYSFYVAQGASCMQSFTTPSGNTIIIQHFAESAIRLIDLIGVNDETLMLQDKAHLIELLLSLSNTLYMTIDTTLTLTLHERGMNILYNPTVYKSILLKKGTSTSYLSIYLAASEFNNLADTTNRYTFTTNWKEKKPGLYRNKQSAIMDSSLLLAADELRWRSTPGKLAPALVQLKEQGLRMVVTAHTGKVVKLEQTTIEALYRYKKFLTTHLNEKLNTDNIIEFHKNATNVRNAKEDFLALFGIQVQKYIHEQRMLRAVRYLAEGQKMEVIANRLGYSRQSSFSEAFEAYFHLSPSEWKRKNL